MSTPGLEDNANTLVLSNEVLLWFALSMQVYNILSRGRGDVGSKDPFPSLFLQNKGLAAENYTQRTQVVNDNSCKAWGHHPRSLVPLEDVSRPAAPLETVEKPSEC